MSNADPGNRSVIADIPPRPIENLKHFISWEDSVKFEKHWEEFRDNLNKLLELIIKDKKGNADLIPLANFLNETLLINYERFDFKSNSGFRHALIKLILDSDCLDVQFGSKPISQDLRDQAKEAKSNAFDDKQFISCVMLTGKNYASDPKDKPCITCITIP
jgi:hypothetical protein